jgi:lipoyl-dependent peroxiredoxin
MSTDRSATTTWQGDVKSGTGKVALNDSGAAGPLDVSFPARAGDPSEQTSPEELLAAAHATCFSMALSSALGSAGHPPEKLETTATVTFSMDGGPHIPSVNLFVRATVEAIDEAEFQNIAEQAKDGCPVSKLFAGNCELTLDAQLA